MTYFSQDRSFTFDVERSERDLREGEGEEVGGEKKSQESNVSLSRWRDNE